MQPCSWTPDGLRFKPPRSPLRKVLAVWRPFQFVVLLFLAYMGLYIVYLMIFDVLLLFSLPHDGFVNLAANLKDFSILKTHSHAGEQ